MAGSKPGERRGGRKKGTPNKVTADIKLALKDLADQNVANVQSWLDKVAQEDPAKALGLYLQLLEFSVSKQARIVDLTTGGQPFAGHPEGLKPTQFEPLSGRP